MQISISARHGSLQPGDHAIIEEKVGKLRRLFDRINAIEVTVDLGHEESQLIEVVVTAEHAGQFVATASAPTVIAALDTVMPKIEQQLRRAKEKRTGHQATGMKHLDGNVEKAE